MCMDYSMWVCDEVKVSEKWNFFFMYKHSDFCRYLFFIQYARNIKWSGYFCVCGLMWCYSVLCRTTHTEFCFTSVSLLSFLSKRTRRKKSYNKTIRYYVLWHSLLLFSIIQFFLSHYVFHNRIYHGLYCGSLAR